MNSISCIIYDPIPFEGGSKIATRHMLEQTPNDVTYHILTSDLNSWIQYRNSATNLDKSRIVLHHLKCPNTLKKYSNGILYWLKQTLYLFNLGFVWLNAALTSFNCPQKLLLISGPGVDFAGYAFTRIMSIFSALPLIQFIHGPVFASRAVTWCLNQNHQTFYLPSSKQQIKTLLGLKPKAPLPTHFQPFFNGIPYRHWPSMSRHRAQQSNATQSVFTPTLFWAASLLKWKGLDRLIDAHKAACLGNKTKTNICYIRPKHSYVEQSIAPITLENTEWFEAPENLDEIRSNSDVFISTSKNEPFGLSILEALASGLLVVIPSDGAYWDSVLTDRLNCVKYDIDDLASLPSVLTEIAYNYHKFETIAHQGVVVAEQYRAEITYRSIVSAILGTDATTKGCV